MIGGSVRASDFRNLDEALQQVEPRMQRNILRTGIRAACNVLRDAAQRGAPQGERGLLRRSIRTVLRRGRPGEARGSVGVFAPSGKAAQKKRSAWAYYAMWVELGHRIIARLPKGARVRLRKRLEQRAAGTVRPRPFLLPALYAKQAEATQVLEDHIRARLHELVP